MGINSITFGKAMPIGISKKVPAYTIEILRVSFRNPGPDIVFVLKNILPSDKVWKKLVAAAMHETDSNERDRIIWHTFSAIVELYRKRAATAPSSNGTSKFQNSKEREKIKRSAKKLSETLDTYPFWDQFLVEYPFLSSLRFDLSNLIGRMSEFEPPDRRRNAIFPKASLGRKSQGIAGQQRDFAKQLSEVFKWLLKSPLDDLVPEVATLLFPESETNLTGEDIRKMRLKV